MLKGLMNFSIKECFLSCLQNLMDAFYNLLNEVNRIVNQHFVNIPATSYTKSRIYISFMSNFVSPIHYRTQLLLHIFCRVAKLSRNFIP